MGTSRTTAEFRQKVAGLPAVVVEAERLAVRANAQLAKDNALKELRRHVPSQRLRNVGRNGTKLNVRYTIDKASGRSADVKAVGPWQFVENDSRNVPYGVGSRYAQGSRRSRSAAILAGDYTVGASRTSRSGRARAGRRAMLRTPWGWRASVKVAKKRQGKHPWRTAFEKTQREAPGVYQAAADKALRKALRG